MRSVAAALLLLTSAALGDGPAPLDTSTVLVHDFATLTHLDARRLEGREALFQVVLDADSDPEERGEYTCADCDGEGMPLLCLYLAPGQGLTDRMTFKAILHVRFYPTIVGADGSRLAPLWESRLVGVAMASD
jgi:hypothetical protein